MKAVVGQDPAQVVVPWENDAEEVESLALEPVDAVPDRSHRRHRRKIVIRRKAAYAQAPILGDRQQVTDCREAATLARLIAIRRVVDTAQIDQLFKARSGSSRSDSMTEK
jgi:hypothetical protein